MSAEVHIIRAISNLFFFWCGFQGTVKVRSKSLTFDDLASLFRVLHVSRVVSGADFEFPFGDL